MSEVQTLEAKECLSDGEIDNISLKMQKYSGISKNDDKDILDKIASISQTSPVLCKTQSKIGEKSFKLTLAGRLLVNHAKGLIENSEVALHRFFNYPIIPGSALKGVARHYAWELWSMAKEDDEAEKALQIARDIIAVFGYPTNDEALDLFIKKNIPNIEDQAGTVIFHTATTIDSSWELVVDVLTPHRGNDYTNPTPRFFLAVEKGSDFEFSLSSSGRGSEENLFKAETWLKEALKVNGVGAKTTSGYGWFTDSYIKPTVEKVKRPTVQKRNNYQNRHSRIQKDYRI